MMYYIFFMVAAANFVAFVVSLVMYVKESVKVGRYRNLESFIRNMEIENLKQAV